MPRTLSILMPGRLLNLDIVLIGPVLIGLIAAYRHRRSAQVLLVALLAGLLLTSKSLIWRWIAERGAQPWSVRIDPVLLFEGAALAILCIALWQATREPVDRVAEPIPSTTMPFKGLDSSVLHGLGWRPKWTLARGLEETHRWYLRILGS